MLRFSLKVSWCPGPSGFSGRFAGLRASRFDLWLQVFSPHHVPHLELGSSADIRMSGNDLDERLTGTGGGCISHLAVQIEGMLFPGNQ